MQLQIISRFCEAGVRRYQADRRLRAVPRLSLWNWPRPRLHHRPSRQEAPLLRRSIGRRLRVRFRFPASRSFNLPNMDANAVLSLRQRFGQWRRIGVVKSPLPYLLAEDVVDRADDDARVLAGELVIDRLAVAPRRHQTVGTQSRELLRHRRLAQVEQLFQFAHRLLALGQNAEHQQTALMRESFEKIARPFGVADDTIELV